MDSEQTEIPTYLEKKIEEIEKNKLKLKIKYKN